MTTKKNTTLRRRRDDYAATLLASVVMNAHDRRNAERDLRNAERIVDLVISVADASKALVRAVRSGFTSPAKVTQ